MTRAGFESATKVFKSPQLTDRPTQLVNAVQGSFGTIITANITFIGVILSVVTKLRYSDPVCKVALKFQRRF